MPYGERCRATSRVKAWFRTPKDRTNKPYQKSANLKPHNLMSRTANVPKILQTSGPGTSTPTASSQTELLDELLHLVNEISHLKWQDDLEISDTSSETSSTPETSFESDYEILEPPLGGPPPKEAPDHPPLKYCPF
nr:ORF3 [Torque teno felis virus]